MLHGHASLTSQAIEARVAASMASMLLSELHDASVVRRRGNFGYVLCLVVTTESALLRGEGATPSYTCLEALDHAGDRARAAGAATGCLTCVNSSADTISTSSRFPATAIRG